jgi:predicted GNAT family N-acyltransferase
MKIVQIVYGSSQWHETLELRERVLRRPLGRQLTTQEINSQRDATHFAVYDSGSGRLLGTLLTMHVNDTTLQMRQVAVEPTMQRTGAGRALVQYAEQHARENGYRTIILHARESAVAFYEKLGYAAEGPLFREQGIPHVLMRKELD